MSKNKWSVVSARPQIAHRYLSSLMFVKYGQMLGLGENPRNYSHKIWLKNIREVPGNEIVAYQNEIEDYAKSVKASANYQALLNGEAPPELILDTLVRYEFVRNCK